MSQARLKKWDERAEEYLALPADHRYGFRAQFDKNQFDAAMLRLAARLRAVPLLML